MALATDSQQQPPLPSGGDVACGVAGWSYPDWNGFVYPAGVKDRLRYVAFYVDVIEINMSFYRPPAAQTAASWEKRTRDLPGFFFTAKLHQDITHGGRLDRDIVDALKRGLEPLATAGRLRHLLAQFRYDFSVSPEAREHLRRIHAAFSDMANIVFEFRHSSWQSRDVLDELAGMGATVAALDYPAGRSSFTADAPANGRPAYFRLHGRNKSAWYSRDAGRDDTYNYLYDEREIAGIVARARRIRAASSSLTIIANNHYQGKELVNALQIMAAWRGSSVRVPPLLAEKYPSLLSCGVIESPPD